MSELAPPPSEWQRLIRRAWPGGPRRWRDVPGRLAPELVSIWRPTAGAVVAYLLTLVLTEGATDLTGALTALLVMQASAFSTLKMGAVRVGAVLGGVLVAVVLSSWIGLTWWSLGAAIAASLVLAKVLRLGDQATETPISAMLILGVTNPDIAAEVRVLNTLIGASVGVAFNLLYPPAMPTRPAGRAVLRVADAVAAPLDAAGRAFVSGPVSREQVSAWLDQVRAASRRVSQAGEAVAALKDARRLNPRALGTVDVQPVLATGLDTLEHCLLAVRALFAVLLSEVPTAGSGRDDPYGEELRSAFAVVLHDVADCLRAFGNLVIAEAESREQETEEALAESLEILRETRAILVELIMVDARDDSTAWLLRGSILAALEQVLNLLNLEDRARVHQEWQEEQRRRTAQLPPILTAALPHPEFPILRGLPPGAIRHPLRRGATAMAAPERVEPDGRPGERVERG